MGRTTNIHIIVFLSTPSARRATYHVHAITVRGRISIHALREEGDSSFAKRRKSVLYFYPRPPRGGRRKVRTAQKPKKDFYPRPPRGGRPGTGAGALQVLRHFYPRPPRGGRPPGLRSARRLRGISIHALREEGDAVRPFRVPWDRYFYPRPPRGGRRVVQTFTFGTWYFYPRPPRGGRPNMRKAPTSCSSISIHALREEGDDPSSPA